MTKAVRMLIFTGFVGLMAITVLSVCGDDTLPPATEAPEGTEAPTVSPTAAPTPVPTAAPTATSAPTQAPSVAPTMVPDTMPEMPALEFSPDMRWGQIIDALSEPEQECINSELGDQLASVRDIPVLSETTEPWQLATVGCLSQETASEIFLASFAAQLPPLSEDAEACVRGLLDDADIAALMASQTAAPDPAAEAAALQFGFGLLTCLPPEMMAALIEGTGAGASTGPAPTDDAYLWRFETGGWVVNPPAVANGVVYAGSDDNFVYALDAETGQMIWNYQTYGIVRSTPTVSGGAVYVGSDDNHMYALDAGTGRMLWSFDTGNSVQYSPLVSNGLVYLSALVEGGFAVHALDAATGTVEWVAEVFYPYGAPFAVTVSNGRVFSPGESGEFYALDASTGEVLWSLDVGLGAQSPPAVVDGVVYLTAVNTAYALDETTGELIWNYGTEMLPAMDRPAVVEDGVYYFAPDHNLYALNTESGHFEWYYIADDFIVDTPLVASGVVYLSLESGVFDAIDASTGGFVWCWENPEAALQSATVVNGILLAESSDGYLRALNAATGEELWSFSKGYFDGVKSYTVDGGVLYFGSLDGNVYAFTFPPDG